jgi:phenylpropionate dioxygenase-like ring-hydroxylating dioxygenase large terminal subunit
MQDSDKVALKAVTAPIETARPLPNTFYTDGAQFAEERDRIFARHWVCIGFAKDVAAPGMAWPLTFLNQPLVVLRDHGGRLRVFQNVCRHRGMVLVGKAGPQGKVLQCPYHSWCYKLDGSLSATPHIGGPGKNRDVRIDPNELGLIEVRSHIFMDLIFVNLSGTAPDFDDWASPLIERWHEFVNQPLHHGGTEVSFQLDVQCNWKLAVENYCEAYHLPWVHPGLNSFSKLEDHYSIQAPGHFSGQGTTVYQANLGDGVRDFAKFENLSKKWAKSAEYVALYPNVLLGVHNDHFFAIQLDPVAVDRTIERVEIYYADAAMVEPENQAPRRLHQAQWQEVFHEDIKVVEGMQVGRSACRFDGGRFSPVMDAATYNFHQWVADQYRKS